MILLRQCQIMTFFMGKGEICDSLSDLYIYIYICRVIHNCTKSWPLGVNPALTKLRNDWFSQRTNPDIYTSLFPSCCTITSYSTSSLSFLFIPQPTSWPESNCEVQLFLCSPTISQVC